MRAWLYRAPEPAWPTGTSVFAEYWFKTRGAETLIFSLEDLAAGRLDHDLREEPDQAVVVGGVGAIHAVLERAGRPIPCLGDLPAPVRAFAGRCVWDATLREVRAIVGREPERLPLHVKPHRSKAFKGTVVGAFRDLIPSAHIDDAEPVLVQEVVPFISEWRAVILRGDLLNVAHYHGDPLRFPDPAPIRAGLEAFEGRPAAFAMDWGVTSDGRTLLVEVNDGYALGNYGLRGTDYCEVLIARWHELMGVSDHPRIVRERRTNVP